MNKIQIVNTGGTVCMGTVISSTGEKLLKPFYSIEHFFLAFKVISSEFSTNRKRDLLQEIVDTKTSKNPVERVLKILQENFSDRLEDICEQYQVNTNILKPFSNNINEVGLIDSIDFDFSIHYETILNVVKQSISEGNSIVFFGGTDSLEFYATALAKSLKHQGLLENSSIIFVSSMYSFEENTSMAANLFISSLEMLSFLSQEKKTVQGAFLISPKFALNQSKLVGFKFHNILSGIVKLSSRLKDSFRSNNGVVYETNFSINRNLLEQISCNVNTKVDELQSPIVEYNALKVSSPLLVSNSVESIKCFLDQILHDLFSGDKNFNYIIIELNLEDFILQPYTFRSDFYTLVNNLKKKGTEIVFVNDMFVKNGGSALNIFEPRFANSEYKMLLDELKTHTKSMFITRPIIEVYVSLKLGFKNFLEKYDYLQDNTDVSISKKEVVINTQEVCENTKSVLVSEHKENLDMSIKYVPDIKDFIQTLLVVKKIKKKYSIEALAGYSLPERCKEFLKENLSKITFKYDNYYYKDVDNTGFKEGKEFKSIYKASEWLRGL